MEHFEKDGHHVSFLGASLSQSRNSQHRYRKEMKCVSLIEEAAQASDIIIANGDFMDVVAVFGRKYKCGVFGFGTETRFCFGAVETVAGSTLSSFFHYIGRDFDNLCESVEKYALENRKAAIALVCDQGQMEYVKWLAGRLAEMGYAAQAMDIMDLPLTDPECHDAFIDCTSRNSCQIFRRAFEKKGLKRRLQSVSPECLFREDVIEAILDAIEKTKKDYLPEDVMAEIMENQKSDFVSLDDSINPDGKELQEDFPDFSASF